MYYLEESEKAIAEKAIQALAEQSDQTVYISVEPYRNFYAAEEYHQDYYRKHPEEFKQELIDSGRLKL